MAARRPGNLARRPRAFHHNGMSIRHSRTIRAIGTVIVAVAAGAVVTPAPAVAVALPGGKANYVVSLGHLANNFRGNWVRLGTYEFSTSGTVTARMWVWSQGNPVVRVGTGTTPDSSCSTTAGSSGSRVRTCQILTPAGFTAAPGETRTGTFTTYTVDVAGVPTPVVGISWNVASGVWSEEWFLQPSPDGLMSRLDFKYNTKALYGYGYGSNAALATRRAMSTVQGFTGTLKMDSVGWASDTVSTSNGQTFNHSAFSVCATTTWCLTYLQPSSTGACQASGGCPNYGGGTATNVSSIQYFIQKLSNTDRRDTLWHWCTCLAMERGEFCYTGNSHVKPMMQIIDDTGAFRGWVGVEASFYNSGGSDPRHGDMISVYRFSDFR